MRSEAPPRRPADGAAGLFAQVARALEGVPISVVLDADGQLVRVEDEAVVWQRLREALEAGYGADAAAAAPFLGALDRLRAEARRRFLASPVTTVIAAAEAERTPQEAGPVTLAVRAPGGATLAGTERVETGTAVVTIATEANGRVETPNAEPVMMRIMRVREVDRASGLLILAREERETALIDGDDPATERAVTIVRVAIATPRSP